MGSPVRGSMVETVPMTETVESKATAIVQEKREAGFGITATTAADVQTDDEIEDRYLTGAKGEVAFALWAKQKFPEREITLMPRGHDYDIEIGDISIDVKASKKAYPRLQISKKKLERKDETPDLWVKVSEVGSSEAKIRGFAYDAGFADPANRVENVHGNGPGYSAGPDSLQYIEDISLLESEIADA